MKHFAISREQRAKTMMSWYEFKTYVENLGVNDGTRIAYIDVESGFELKSVKTEPRTDGAVIIKL